jgi:uncharacterized membrane protein
LKFEQQLKETNMDRMLVVVFDSEKKAYDGEKALEALDAEGSISAYAWAVVAKQANGTVTVKQEDDPGPIGTLLATTLGGVIGLLGGPAASVAGATAGLSLGSAFDINNARIGEDFIDDVSKELTPNRFALVAEIDEEWTTPVDTRMEAIGGSVFRRALSEVNDAVDREDVAAMKADATQMKNEMAKAHADRKAKLQEKVTLLEARIQAQQEKSKARRQAHEQQAEAKAKVLKSRAKSAGKALKDLANTPI